MRVALISDLHGNDVAFAAALADIERVGVDEIVCLGDALQGGPQPEQTAARLRELGCRTVLGNADAFLLEVDESSPEPVTEQQLEVRTWTLSELGSPGLELIRSFAPTVETTAGAQRLLCFHGSPRSYDDVLLPEDGPEALTPFLGLRGFDVLAGGHTHKQWTRVVEGALYVNPGSVGHAYDHHQRWDDLALTPVAEYALVYGGENGSGIEFRRVAYSIDELQDEIASSGRPHAATFAARWRRP